jgi:predicted RNA-binding protein Jag
MSKEETIRNYMEKLDLSFQEALSLWEDEQEDNLPELTPEQKAVAKEMAQADRKKESTPRKRERKPDDDKRELIKIFEQLLDGVADEVCKVTNPEREIEFNYNGNRYRLTLSKPRKEKSV